MVPKQIEKENSLVKKDEKYESDFVHRNMYKYYTYTTNILLIKFLSHFLLYMSHRHLLLNVLCRRNGIERQMKTKFNIGQKHANCWPA